MLKILRKIVNYWNLKAHFEFRQVYNAQIMKHIQISNVTSCNLVQRYVCWKFNVSDASVEGTQAYEHYVDRVSNCEVSRAYK